METQLANANLLDDTVSNSGSLKTNRIKKTAQTASNPNPNPQRKEQQTEQQNNMDGQENDYNVNEENADYGRTEPSYNTTNKSNASNGSRKNSTSEDKKIMGMKPALFYTLAGVAVVLGGIYLYSRMKKGKGATVKSPIKSVDAGSATESVSEAAKAVATPASPVTTVKAAA